jgi:hypothetical protein
MRQKIGIGFASLAVAMFGVALLAAVNEKPRDAEGTEQSSLIFDDHGQDPFAAPPPDLAPEEDAAPQKASTTTSRRPAARRPVTRTAGATPTPKPQDTIDWSRHDSGAPRAEEPGGQSGDEGGNGGGSGGGASGQQYGGGANGGQAGDGGSGGSGGNVNPDEPPS